MRKILYINLSFMNYQNKTLAQLHSFERAGFLTYAGTMERRQEYVVQTIFEVRQGRAGREVAHWEYDAALFRTRSRIYLSDVFKHFSGWITENKIELVYIRRLLQRIFFSNKFFRAMKNSAKVIYELPTYPLDPSDRLSDRFNERVEMMYFKLFVEPGLDLVAVCLQKDCVLPEKYLPFSNGIDAQRYKPGKIPELKEEFTCIAFAHVRYWHGYERVIEGIKKYQGPYTLRFDIYSNENNTTEELKKAAAKYGLMDNIVFHEAVPLEEMSGAAAGCHIGIGGLAYHKRGAALDTSLKSKEYAALGLPFIYEVPDMSINENWPYHFRIPQDDTPIDFEKVILWYKSLPPDYKVKMHEFAAAYLQYDTEVRDIKNRLFKSDRSIN